MSGRMEVIASVSATGPLADGMAETAVREWLAATVGAIADEGVRMLRDFPMDKTGRATGAFAANLHVMRRGLDAVIPGPMISGVTWGPWLEGVSKRNRSTRFRGYHLFRQTRDRLQEKAPGIAEEELAKYIDAMGGTLG
jgi:hypothetical protein